VARALSAAHVTDFDPTSMRDVRRVVAEHEPAAVVWMAFWDDVDAAEAAEDRAYRHNAEAVISLAAATMEFAATPVLISTPEVFGQRGGPFAESDDPEPRSVWAESRRRGEIHLNRAAPKALILRAGPILSEGLAAEQRALRGGLAVGAARKVSPISAAALAIAIEKLLAAGTKGVVHLAPEAPVRERDFYNAIAERAGLPPVRERQLRELESPSPAMRSDRLEAVTGALPRWRDALETLVSGNDAASPSDSVPTLPGALNVAALPAAAVWARGEGWAASRYALDTGATVDGEGALALFVEAGKVALTAGDRDEILKAGQHTQTAGVRHRIVALQPSIVFTVDTRAGP
jgi:dTDP-4-dehydrorhamnose reductase